MSDLIENSVLIEKVARALQRLHCPDNAEAIWDEELEPDAYKEEYRKEARLVLSVIEKEMELLRVGADVVNHHVRETAEWASRARAAEQEVEKLKHELASAASQLGKDQGQSEASRSVVPPEDAP